jgi:transposase
VRLRPCTGISLDKNSKSPSRNTSLQFRIDNAIPVAVSSWRWQPVVEALCALRGIALLSAATLVAEIGAIERFQNPRQLMAYLGLSSGQKRRQGAITKAGNSHARRMLIECAWLYRHSAKVAPILQSRLEKVSPQVREIAWKAQVRHCGRFRKLATRKLQYNRIVVAIARELVGFIWDIARTQAPRPASIN